MKLQVVPIVVAALVTGCGATSVTSTPTTSTGSSAGQPPSSTPVPAPPAPTESAAPAGDADPMRFSWSEVAFEGSVSAISGDGSRFVAVGTGTDGVSSWTSSDGITWEEHDVPERSFGQIGDGIELTASMGGLIRLGDTLYSFGGMTFMDSATGAGADGNIDNLCMVRRAKDFTEMVIEVEVWDLDHLTRIMSGLKGKSVISKVDRVFS